MSWGDASFTLSVMPTLPLANLHRWTTLALGWPKRRCLACGEGVEAAEPVVELHGSVFHAACARYRTRPRRTHGVR